jgi:hypothetical protein
MRLPQFSAPPIHGRAKPGDNLIGDAAIVRERELIALSVDRLDFGFGLSEGTISLRSQLPKPPIGKLPMVCA